MRATVTRRRWTTSLCVLSLLAAQSAFGQTYYKWTDNRGIVHFSDAPPSNVKGVEERVVNAPPIVRQSGDATPPDGSAESGQPPSPGAAAGGPSEAPPTGPARVVLLSRETPRISPSSVRIMGRVRNLGAESASNVTVGITVVDETQGTVCMQEQADVNPGTLTGGKGGTFDITLDNPCLYGAANLNIEPQWQ